MSKKNTVVIHEFGILSDKSKNRVFLGEEVQLEHKTFENLWNFILENKDGSDADADDVMSVHVKGGRQYIKTGRYVGTIQTKDGQIIEILPKIYKSGNKEEDDKKLCRRVFLKMLACFQQNLFKMLILIPSRIFPSLKFISAVIFLKLNGF